MKRELILSNSKLSCSSKFFAPVDSSKVESLFISYKIQKQKIIDMHSVISDDDSSHTLDYFTNSRWDKYHNKHFDPREVFTIEPALAYLNATFWKMAIALTDVYDNMPSKDRDEWNRIIIEHETMPFDDDLVIDTLKTLLNSREEYLSRRVQDIFEGLSGEHVTNSPQAFNKKMIMDISYDKRIGLINDLRDIISKFASRGSISYRSTANVIDGIYKTGKTGEYVELDGGAIKLRVYLKQTAHMEIHQDICWRLNEILAINNPRAIPAEFRRKPERKYKEFDYSQNLISFNVLAALSNIKQSYITTGERYNTRHAKINNCFSSFDSSADKHTSQQVDDIMIACGGVRRNIRSSDFQFDYDFSMLVPEIIRTGSIPDKRAHQFYPTELELSKRAAGLLDIQPGDKCLEPSAGQGGLLCNMPINTVAVEISLLQCELLKLKGFTSVINSDFIDYAKTTNDRFDKILMNPPFSQGRHVQHLHAAMNLLNDDGELVAILPVSAKNTAELDGFSYKWSNDIHNAFKGVGVVISILKVTRK
jgi:hypothetical protein